MRRIKLFFFAAVIILVACESKGPQSHVTFPDRSEEQLIKEIIDASERDGYYYKCSVELYSLDDGDWECEGMHDVYTYANGKSKCNDWVKFGNELMPVYYTDKGGYTFRTKYMGVDYYY